MTPGDTHIETLLADAAHDVPAIANLYDADPDTLWLGRSPNAEMGGSAVATNLLPLTIGNDVEASSVAQFYQEVTEHLQRDTLHLQDSIVKCACPMGTSDTWDAPLSGPCRVQGERCIGFSRFVRTLRMSYEEVLHRRSGRLVAKVFVKRPYAPLRYGDYVQQILGKDPAMRSSGISY